MERRERSETSSADRSILPPASVRSTRSAIDAALAVDRLLAPFSPAERHCLRYVRYLFECGKLTEFPDRPRD